MNSFEQPYYGTGEILFPVLSVGVLLTAVITFGLLAVQKRDAHVYWSVFTLLLLSIFAVGTDAAVLISAGLFGRTAIAMQLNRLFELSTTTFAITLPYALWAVLPGESRLRVPAQVLLIAGTVLTATFAVLAFAAPDLFVSVTVQSTSSVAYSSGLGRGLRGELFPIRDAAIGAALLANLVLGFRAVSRREIRGTASLLVVGMMISAIGGCSALYANFVGGFPGPLAHLRFSRVGFSVTLFTLLATAAYVLRYFRQSRALDEANRELQHRKDRLAFLAYHNDLTQMPNKQALLRDVDALFPARDGGHGVSDLPFAEAFLCDLDSFGSVEESYGFSFSVSLLRRVGRRIHSYLTQDDRYGGTVYHIEGDRFAVLVPHPLSEDERERLEELLVREISTPISVEGHEVFLSAGIGHCSVATDAGHAEEVIRRLKRGLAAATDENERVGRYSPDMGAAVEASQQLVQDLRRAIRQEDFRVYYQPIVDRDGRVCSCEALIRWHRADTDRFIALAEQSGLIVPITDFVVRTVCADLARLQDVAPGISVNINISARHITQIGFPTILEDRVSRHGLDPSTIGVEITETSFLRADHEVAAVLQGLTAAGFTVAIDDFGTGYSSMSYLKQIPARTLKIDRSFIRELPNAREDRALVDAMILLAHDLGKRVVAEGVETAEQAGYLIDAGIDCLQGYHFARAVPPEEFAETVAAIPRHAAGRSRAHEDCI